MGSSDSFDILNHSFHIVASSIGIAANTLLLFAITRRSTRAIQTYSIILLNTAVIDLIGTIVGVLTTARVVSNNAVSITYLIFTGPCSMAGATYCSFLYGILSIFVSRGKGFSALQNEMYTTSNYFLCFAFAFRLFSIYNNTPNKKASCIITSSVVLISLLILCSNVSIGLAAFSLFMDNNSDMWEFVSFYPQYKGMIEAGFTLGAVHYHSAKSFLTAMFIVSSSPIVFVVAFFLRSRTIRALERTSNLMSSATKDVHRMLVTTLNFQLALTTFVGIGSGIYVFNLMGWISHPLTEITPCAIANLLPSIAPIFNLLCIRPYRLFLIEAIRSVIKFFRHSSKISLLRPFAFIQHSSQHNHP